MTGKQQGAQGHGERLPARTRDRRPALAALAVLLILVGALGSALLVFRTGDRVDVLVAARDIAPGTQITREDFAVARVATEGGSVVQAGAIDSFIGSYSTTGVPEGTLISNRMFTVNDVVPDGAQLVGVTAQTSLRPSEPIGTGDVVALYRVPQDSATGSVEIEATTVVSAARVVHVASATSGGDLVHLTVLLADDDVAEVVLYNAYSQIAVTRLPADTEPPIDQPAP